MDASVKWEMTSGFEGMMCESYLGISNSKYIPMEYLFFLNVLWWQRDIYRKTYNAIYCSNINYVMIKIDRNLCADPFIIRTF